MSVPTATARLVLPLHELRLWGPCRREYALVAERYPDGVPLTVETLVSLAEAGVHVYWGIGAFLSTAAVRPAGKLFRESVTAAERTYWVARDVTWERYLREQDRDSYDAEQRAAQLAYLQAVAPALTSLLAWLAAHPETASAAGVAVQP